MNYIDKYKKTFSKYYDKNNKLALLKYAQFFLAEFGEVWNGIKSDTNKEGKYFFIDIYYHKEVVGMNFILSNIKREKEIEFININQKLSLFNARDEIFKNIGMTFINGKTDLMGFQENSFYKINHNIKGFWNDFSAISDIREFKDAMMKSGIKKVNSK